MSLAGALRLIAQMRVTTILVLLILILAVLGSCFPQRSPSLDADADRLERWESSLRARYGPVTDPLRTAGVFRWFHSPIFLIPIGLLVLAVLVCTVKRWPGVWSRTAHRSVCCSDATFVHAAHTAQLCLRSGTDPTDVVRESLEKRGYTVRSEVDGDLVHVRGDRNRMARLATLVTHAAVLLLVLGVALSSVLGWREELTLGRGEAADVGAGRRWGGKDFQPSNGGSGLRVRSEGFSILRYADGTVAGYEAQVEISQAGLDTMRGQIRLNEPLSYRGVAFTLYGYSSNGESQSITLQAVHDPGYGLSVASGLMMFLGMTVSFNFPPCCVYVRVQPGGVLRLAGRADRRAWGFARQFAALVDEIRGSTGTYTDS